MKNIVTIRPLAIEKELHEINGELTHLLEGKLYARKGVFHYKIGRKEIGITKQPNLIRQLCRRAYLQARKSQLENNLYQPVAKNDNRTPRQLIAELPNAYQSVPEEYFYHAKVENFLAKPPRFNTLNPEQEKYLHNGIKYRSLSEREIAVKQTANNLLFYYDARFNLGFAEISADFYIMNPFTGKYFLWEFFGAFNKPNYGAHMNDKMAHYRQINFVEHDNLIVTFEHHLRDTTIIQELIDNIIWS